jgi:hypothetical protein
MFLVPLFQRIGAIVFVYLLPSFREAHVRGSRVCFNANLRRESKIHHLIHAELEEMIWTYDSFG